MAMGHSTAGLAAGKEGVPTNTRTITSPPRAMRHTRLVFHPQRPSTVVRAAQEGVSVPGRTWEEDAEEEEATEMWGSSMPLLVLIAALLRICRRLYEICRCHYNGDLRGITWRRPIVLLITLGWLLPSADGAPPSSPIGPERLNQLITAAGGAPLLY